MRMTIPVPDTLADALKLALEDLEKCEKDPKYIIDMGIWHETLDSGRCMVCLAGSVMAQHGVNLSSKVFSSCFDSTKDPTVREWDNVFNALDYLRLGWIEEALSEFYGVGINDYEFPTIYIPFYRGNSGQFKARLWELQAILEDAGL